MTQPDQYFPDTSVNALSFADYAATTEEEWDAQIRSGVTSHFLDAESGFLGILTQIPIIGDIIEVITGVEDGDLDDLGTWVNNLDDMLFGIIEDIAGAITGVAGAGIDAIASFFESLGGLLGNPNLGGGAGSGGSGGGSTPPSNTESLQQLLGLLGTDAIVPTHLLAALAPGQGDNSQPDATFKNRGSVEGQGLWIWDRPGKGGIPSGTGCVRTKRPGTITIFHVIGSVHINLFGIIDINALPPPVTLMEFLLATAPLDFTRLEWVNVPYPAMALNEFPSKEEGVRNLVEMIKQAPGPFCMAGESQGAWVISDVYDLMRQGFYINPDGKKITDTSIMDRREDFLMGLSIANPRREQGRTFPGGPLYGDGEGIVKPTLANTEDLWWEWSVGPGTYPKEGNLEGAVYDLGDVVSMCPPGAAGDYIRSSHNYQIIVGVPYNGPAGSPGPRAQDYINLLLGPGEAHGDSFAKVQPFLAQGDDRTFIQIAIEAVNNLAPQVSPPVNGVRHQLEGVSVPVEPFQVVVAGAQVQWLNVVAEGPVIMVAVNAYDSNGSLIATVTADEATISNPVASIAEWVPLEASFVMPEGAAQARLLFNVEPEAMTTGTVWFDEAFLEVTTLINSAFLGNLENHPELSGELVTGPQGQANMLTAIQNTIDGLASANNGQPMTGVQLADMLSAAAQAAINASTALQLGVKNNQQINNAVNQPVYNGLQPTGEVTFPINSFQAGETLPSIDVPAGTSTIGFINCVQPVKKGFIEFMAQGVSDSGVYLNVYRVDRDTGDMTKAWTSDDLSAEVTDGSFVWVSVDIPDEEQVEVTIGELIALELAVEGGGVSIAGQSIALPNNPNSVPQNLGATRTLAATGGTSPASLTEAQVTFSGEEPFVVFGVRNVPKRYEAPNQQSFTAAGEHTYQFPSYIESGDKVDIVAVGAGGGAIGGLLGGGPGGAAGSWSITTLTYGDDIPASTTELTVTVGQGGKAAAGQDTVITGDGFDTVTASGGAGGAVASGAGQSPGNQTVKGRTYFGGAAVAAKSGHPGSKPGGGGASGGLFAAGGPGADGGAWITVRRSDLVEPETTRYVTAGEYTYTIEEWANTLDVIILGGGGSGASYDAATSTAGDGGASGEWTTTTIQKDDFPPGGEITVTVGAGSDPFPDIAYDAVGEGVKLYDTSFGFTPITSAEFLATAEVGAAVVLAVGCRTVRSVGSPFNVTATYGGRPMTVLVTKAIGSSNVIALLGLADAGTGAAETVSISVSQDLGGLTANCASYVNVGSFGTTTTGEETGGTASLSVTLAPSDLAFAAFAARGGSGLAFSSFNQTQRYSDTNDTFYYANALVIGDAAEGTNAVFTATSNGSDCGGAAVVLKPTFQEIAGSSGAPSTISATGLTTYTADGGAGGQYAGGGINGSGAGSKTYNSDIFTGGGPQVVAGANGNAPGGGGAGGSVTGQNGGAGADGAVWIVARPE